MLKLRLTRLECTRRKQRCLDGEQEAHLVAFVCSEAPTGGARWSVRLLADEMIRLGYVESVSHETVRQTLKKTSFSPGSKTAG
ncbi:helix-turn-helix domain-containing protein [Phormidium tenue FACHB-886]|nr:helix-turn-helix domain-containing protein [Phormidium tenue FACHB-886]